MEEGVEPVREDAHRSPSGSECVSRDGRRFRRLSLGEEILKKDFCLRAHEVMAEEVPTPVASWGFHAYEGMGCAYYRPLPPVPKDAVGVPERSEGLQSLHIPGCGYSKGEQCDCHLHPFQPAPGVPRTEGEGASNILDTLAEFVLTLPTDDKDSWYTTSREAGDWFVDKFTAWQLKKAGG